jgi:hypothetical protein
MIRQRGLEGETMQKVNGVEQQPAEATAAPVMEDCADVARLSPELIARLKSPLPPEAVSPNPQRPGFSAIKPIYIVERLNEVFELNGWRFTAEIVESGRMVVVKGTLEISGYGIHIEQYGGNDNSDRGDAYKGACTDALSKCASYVGIGMDVYKGLHDHHGKNGSNSHPSGSRNGRVSGATERRQVQPDRKSLNRSPTGLTSGNIAARFSSMRTVLGGADYGEILGRYGYREVADIPSLEKAREVYCVLLEDFRERFGEAMRSLGMKEYEKILRELRLRPHATLNPEQAVRVFNHMQETLTAKE